ncbi:MAG: membrane protein insertion efficiency factor YidD [candidate division KSB1 bacterium]|nr:membrane protein insertion efficiency factor YidD [candidate division KSB1 bacterium]MDZ7367231.1 membrane protein insertion efficiency factor YidD [candidate division KSB1 bacterium]
MRLVIIGLIRIYRQLISPERRRRCLFRESCSAYVERSAREGGSLAAIRALRRRYRCCRPGYGFQFKAETNNWELVCADGSRFSPSEAASHLASEFHVIMQQIKI